MTKTPLLPGQIPTGGFHTGLPYMHQGVEERGRSGLPPPMINTVASDRVAQLGRNGPAPMTAALPAPPSMMMAAPRQAPVNPLGGMDSRPLSERSSAGPMSYAPRGVGTNNPNSYAVGRNNKDFAMRTGQAPMMMQPGQGPRGQAPMMLGGFVPPQSSNGMPPPPMLPAPGRDDAFWNQMSSDTSAFLGEQQKLGMDMQLADQTAAAEVEKRAQNTAGQIMEDMRKGAMARETYPINDPITGLPHQGHFMTGNGMMAPRMQAPPAGLVPTGAMIGGVQYEQPQTSAATKPPAFTYEKDPNGKITGAVYPVQDPKTGEWKLQRADLNGDGVVSPEEAAQMPAPVAAAAPVKTKGGNSYTLK